MNDKPHSWLRRILLASGVWLLCVSPAFATGSMQCEGPAYAVEIQFSLSTGRLTELIVVDTRNSQTGSTRFALQQRFVDYKRKVMRVAGTSLERPEITAALRVSNATGTLTYRGAQHKLRCDWSGRG